MSADAPSVPPGFLPTVPLTVPKLPTLSLRVPGWTAPAGVGAAMSTRHGGVSQGPWATLNLGAAVGDDAQAVSENRRRLAVALGAQPVWLRQVHGTAVRRLVADDPRPGAGCNRSKDGIGARDSASVIDTAADAAWTDVPGMACAVLVADCLPVLFTVDDGRAVAAAHAGWRGLAAGVLDATVQALCSGSGVAPSRVRAWVGPGIGPRQFEVGADVLAAFGASAAAPGPHFVARPRPDGALRWLADLPALAVRRLQAAGVQAVSVDGGCTVEAASDFFSFRRDGVTGRMAAAVWRRE